MSYFEYVKNEEGPAGFNHTLCSQGQIVGWFADKALAEEAVCLLNLWDLARDTSKPGELEFAVHLTALLDKIVTG